MNDLKKTYQPPGSHKRSTPAPLSGRNDNWIFFTAILVSVIFWILIKLSDQYTVPYALRVHYINVPKEKRLTSMTDSIANIHVTARGYEILEINLFENTDVLEIDLANFSLMKKEGREYFIYTEELTERIADAIGIPKKKIRFSKSTLSFTLSDLAEKVLPVTNRVNIRFAEQYDLYQPPLLSQETVTVFGPPEVLDTLTQIFTLSKLFEQVNSNLDIKVKLFNPLPTQLNFEPGEIDISFRVEKFTASSIEVPVDLPGLRQSIKLFPKKVRVHFKVAIKDYNNVRVTQFEVVPDMQNIDIHTAVRLPLKLAKKPDFVRNTTLDPPNVEFLIIR